MPCAIYDDLAEQEGFQRLGELQSRIRLRLWWQAASKIHLLVLPVGRACIVKGSKSYYLQSLTEEGATWSRDIGPLHDYLEAHFPDLHISFSFFRDVSSSLAAAHVRKKRQIEAPTLSLPTVEDLAERQRQISSLRNELTSTERTQSILEGESDLLGPYLRERSSSLQQELRAQAADLDRDRDRVSLLRNLQQRYKDKGSAACFRFTIASHLHTATSQAAFVDATRAIVKELTDLHRYQVFQKLAGGRLKIQAEEAQEPSLTWLEETLCASLSPIELERLDETFQPLRIAAEKHLMVTPDADIEIDATRKDDRKRLGARAVSNLLGRLDHPDRGRRLERMTADSRSAWIGTVLVNGQATKKRCELPFDSLKHVYVSGTTGSGKSFAGRILIEEACEQGLHVLCLDPRNQSAGLLAPEDRDSILARYPEFGLKQTDVHGFDFSYLSPSLLPEKMPSDLSSLATGRNILSFKGLSDQERCQLFSQVLDAVFDAQAGEESDSIRFLLVIEESQRFTKKRVSSEAKQAAEQAERALDRTVREGRKYGCCVVIISQTIRDFAYDSASIRQNTNTKIFLHNSDREVDYAATCLDNAKQITQLEPGTAIVFNPAWGAVAAKIRPPRSKVWEYSDESTLSLLGRSGDALEEPLSLEAKRALGLIRRHFVSAGRGMNLSQLAKELEIGSRRRLHGLVGELESKRVVRTRKLRERGHPRVLEPVKSDPLDDIPGTTRTVPGGNGQDGSGSKS